MLFPQPRPKHERLRKYLVKGEVFEKMRSSELYQREFWDEWFKNNPPHQLPSMDLVIHSGGNYVPKDYYAVCEQR